MYLLERQASCSKKRRLINANSNFRFDMVDAANILKEIKLNAPTETGLCSKISLRYSRRTRSECV